MKRVIKIIYSQHRCVLTASRQLGKSTIAACLLSWALVFFHENRAIILNMKKSAAYENLDKVRFIINNLPKWMVTDKPFKTKSELKSYFILFNNSRLDAFYPSTVHNSATLARSLSSPILYIDEAAYIPKMNDIFASAQQTLSKARMQAMKRGYPYFILITSTPNGTYGDGEWFYKRYSRAVDSDLLFVKSPNNDLVEIWNKSININEKLNNSNQFIRIRYHWSEDPTKDKEWYNEQIREIDDERRVHQELDLEFIGTERCIFSDSMLNMMNNNIENVKSIINLSHGTELKVFKEKIDPSDYYLVGCDTAESLTGAYCAIEVFGFRNFNQIAEFQARLGSYSNFADIIDDVFKWLKSIVGNKIILCVERNTIGKAPIEILLKYKQDENYHFHLYKETKDEKKGIEYGIYTNSMSKSLMFGLLMGFIRENEKSIVSQDLVNQYSCIERTNSGLIRSTSYSDLAMASCFCAYVRQIKSIDIMPLIEKENNELVNDFNKTISVISEIHNIKKMTNNFSDSKQNFIGKQKIGNIEEDIIYYENGLINDSIMNDLFPF
jgi:hypothetical protein